MPRGVRIHGSAHRLNFVLKDTCKAMNYFSDYFFLITRNDENPTVSLHCLFQLRFA